MLRTRISRLFLMLMLAAILPLTPARAERDQYGEVPVRPVKTVFRAGPSPRFFCDADSKAAALRIAQTALDKVTADADAARAYRALLQDRIQAEAGDESARRRDATARDDFAKRDLDDLTLRYPAAAEEARDAVKAALVENCATPEAIERLRPALPTPVIPLAPDRLCSEEEKLASLARAEAAYLVASEAKRRAEAYAVELASEIATLRLLARTAARIDLIALLTVEADDWAHVRQDVDDRAGRAFRAIEDVRAMQPQPCADDGGKASAPPGVATVQIPSPPMPPPLEVPPRPKFCKEADRVAYRRDVLGPAIERASAYFTAISAYRSKIRDAFQTEALNGGSGANLTALYRALTAAAEASDEASGALNDLVGAYADTASIPLDPCPDDGASPPPGIPVRPPFKPIDFAPQKPCTEDGLIYYLNYIAELIAKADANIETANAHLKALGALFGGSAGDIARQQNVKAEIEAYRAVLQGAVDQAADLRATRAQAAGAPLAPCGEGGATPAPPPSDGLAQPPKAGGGSGKACLPGSGKRPRKPITLGSRGKIGSTARGRQKALSTVTGILGGFLPGGGGGGGGGAGGPPLVQCRIRNSEMTVFDDPASGVSLSVGAKRAGNDVIVFANIAKSPDSGTFQGSWMGMPGGGVAAPAQADICSLWGEWSLTVSWTKTTYVNDQVVSRESGGYSRSGEFSLPGMISSDAAPQGLWRQFGFSNASHGAREVALRYPFPPGGAPVPLFIHITRPSLDPVVTLPFALVMTEGPSGFTFARAQLDDCDE